MKKYILTKTKITSGLQCHKKLWFDVHQKIKIKKSVFNSGNRFGEVVRNNYKSGYGKFKDFSPYFAFDYVANWTKEAIKSNKINVIFEGAFIYLNTLVLTDVLIRKKNGWELLEAKSSSELKPQHIEDTSIQSFVVKKCMKELGTNLVSVKLIHINKDFIYKGDENYKDLINDNTDITSEVFEKEKEVPNYIEDLIPLASENSPCPNIEMGDHCKNPYSCDYQDRCKSLLPKSNITSYRILPNPPRNKEFKKYCKDKGYKDLDLRKVLDKFLNEKSYKHKTIQNCHKTNNPWINKDLKNVFKDLSWPFYFMDFEFVFQGVPIIKGTKPNERLPFQWSVHKWESIDKEMKSSDHEFFLDFKDQNIERKFIENLLKAVGKQGTIFAHNAKGTEISILNQLKEKDNCKDLTDEIEKLISRIKDTLNIVKENFYSPLMNGSYKIKKIINVVPSSVSYDEKDNIEGGQEASLAWFICTDPTTDKNKEEQKKQKKLLMDYCSKDTLAVYHLVKYLMEKTKDKKN